MKTFYTEFVDLDKWLVKSKDGDKEELISEHPTYEEAQGAMLNLINAAKPPEG